MAKDKVIIKNNNISLNHLKKYNDISCYTYPFPTGRLYIFGCRDSIKLVLFGHRIDHKKEIEKKFSSRITEEIEKAVVFLDNYLIGKKKELPVLDFSIFSDKEKAVYNELLGISFGETVSYKELSQRSGVINGARFVGNAMAKNIFPVFVPCHRVINSNGSIGNYSGGKEIKRFLLQHENVLFGQTGRR
jgi:methylated-DNA-[protein]-cysteine S-methyltransferase